MTADHRSREPKRRSEMDAPIGERVQNVEAPAPAHAVFFPARRGRRWRQRLIADQPRLPRHVQHARRMHKARRDGGWLDKALRGGSRILVTLKCNRCLQGARVQSVQPQVRAAAITAWLVTWTGNACLPILLSGSLQMLYCYPPADFLEGWLYRPHPRQSPAPSLPGDPDTRRSGESVGCCRNWSSQCCSR